MEENNNLKALIFIKMKFSVLIANIDTKKFKEYKLFAVFARKDEKL